MSAPARTRVSGRVLALAGALVAAPATAQDWSVYAGAAGRFEYNDNYFFTAPGQQTPGNPGTSNAKESAFTVSVIPFVAAARRTEVTDVSALLAVGANKVWGLPSSEEYLSGRFSLSGELRQERATWSAGASYSRSPLLQNVVRDAQPLLVLTNTDTAALTGAYSYALDDRWTIGATVSGFANRYDVVQGTGDPPDNRGFSAGGNARYAVSEKTQAAATVAYAYYTSDPTHSNAITTTLGIAHRFSPDLTVSGSIGGFWSSTTAKQALGGQGTPIPAGETRDDRGPLFGGSIAYALSANTEFTASLSQSLAPSGTGTISEILNASLSLAHQFSDRLAGRLGGNYGRTRFPAALNSSYNDTMVAGQAVLSYVLAERWKLEAGYQYMRGRYGYNSSEPSSNLLFLSIGYNWPGGTFTGWIGMPTDTQSIPGAGPLSLPETQRGRSGTSPGSASPETSPFEPYTLP